MVGRERPVTALEIASRLVDSPKGITPKRTEKAKILAQRSKVDWSDVLACLTPDQRGQL